MIVPSGCDCYGMPSRAMQDAIDTLKDRQQGSASQPPLTLDERRAAMEVLVAIKRAGADMILTYFAQQAARELNS